MVPGIVHHEKLPHLRAVDLGLELGIYAYDAYILEAARSSGFPLLALDGPIRRNAKKLGLSQVELDR